MKSKKSFINNTLNLVIGNTSAQIINLLTVPVIARLYGPENYGILTLFLAIASIISEGSSLRMETTILLPPQKKDAVSLFHLSILFVFFFSTILIGIYILFDSPLYYFPTSYVVLEPYLLLIALYVFLTGINRSLSFLMVREDDFSALSISKIGNTIVSKLFTILFYIIVTNNPIGLIGGLIAGCFTTSCLFFKRVYQNDLMTINRIDLNNMKKNLVQYKTYAIYSGTAILESFSRETLPLLLGVFFNPIVVGFFGLANRVAKQPLNVFSDAISKSLFQKISLAHQENNDYGADSFELFKTMFSIIIIPLALFVVISPEIFEIIFGEKWKTSGIYFSVMSFSFLSSFFYRVFSIIFDVQERQKLRFYLNLFRIFTGLFFFIAITYYFETPIYAVCAYSISNATITFATIILLLHLTGLNCHRIIAYFFKYLLISLLTGAIFLYLKSHCNINVFLLLAINGSFIFFYLIYVGFHNYRIKTIFLKFYHNP